ncbi:hypothetical protein ALC57_04444, partial [Trachymyrmex cornetzi]
NFLDVTIINMNGKLEFNLYHKLFTFDNAYRHILSRIRIVLVTGSDIDIFQSRKIHFKGRSSCDERLNELCTYMTQLPADTICSLPTCYLCKVLNAAVLDKIKMVVHRKQFPLSLSYGITIHKSQGIKKYKVMSAIFHEGEEMNRYHYTCMLRTYKKSEWCYSNDLQVIKKKWPRGAQGAYTGSSKSIGPPNIFS